MSGILQYDSNNSGGNWWLEDKHWAALAEAGWVVHYIHAQSDDHGGADYPRKGEDGYDPHMPSRYSNLGGHKHSYGAVLIEAEPSGEDWLGAKAKSAAKRFEDADTGIAEWEQVVGMSSTAEGCNCCGPPHSFEWTDDDGSTRHRYVEVTQTAGVWT